MGILVVYLNGILLGQYDGNAMGYSVIVVDDELNLSNMGSVFCFLYLYSLKIYR